jgi:hypothetical protein
VSLLGFPTPPPPPGLVAVSYGGGVNTIALLVALRRMGVVPKSIVMANPGSERKETLRYLGLVARPWLRSIGFPSPKVISRKSEGRHRERAWRLETLREECMRIRALPSVAYGWKKCSAKYKGDPQRWHMARQPWALAEWAAGRRIVKAIGYDVGEGRRVRRVENTPWEAERFVPWYPLHAAGLEREDCEALILSEGLPLPPKSACKWCPNNTIEEWEELRDTDPEGLAEALAMSRNAIDDITTPDVVGLMRCNDHGKRQLHVWVEGGYGGACGTMDAEDSREAQPCECAL